MNKQLADLACRRLEILDRIAAQRTEMADISGHFHKPLAVADTGLKVARFVYSHPVLVAGGFTALLIWRRKGIPSFAKEVWSLLHRYPSAALFGLNLILSATHSGEERNTEDL